MKQLSKSDSQFGFLDPEKVYFVEKFGYLVKKINGGYGGPVQEALVDRIIGIVNDFKTDLPNIVHNLEVNRLKIISRQNRENVTGQMSDKPKSNPTVVARAAEATRIISKKIIAIEEESVARKFSSVSKVKPVVRENRQTFSNVQTSASSKPIVKSSVPKKEMDITNLLAAKQSRTFENKRSSILRPSVAAIREEQRLEQIKAMQQKKESFKTGSEIREQSTTKPKELTEWERRWHKYDSDIVDHKFNGYVNS